MKAIINPNQFTLVIDDLREIKLSYDRQFNIVRILRKDEVLRTDSVSNDFTLNAFIDMYISTKYLFSKN